MEIPLKPTSTTNYEHRDALDHLQDLFEQRARTDDMIFRHTLKREILQLCDTFEDYTAKDRHVWYDYGVINSTIILVTVSPRWCG